MRKQLSGMGLLGASVVSAVLAITVIVRWHSQDSLESSVQSPTPGDSASTQAESANQMEVSPATGVQSTAAKDVAPVLHHSHNHHQHGHAVANSAADFRRLPIPMQQEIKALTGRDNEQNSAYESVEVKPGVVAVLSKNGPRVVPVAVINPDGSVSIHEY